MRIAHLHIPGIIDFQRASVIQQNLVTRFLAHKKLRDDIIRRRETSTKEDELSNKTPGPLDPVIFTFSPSPTYTTGRREFPKQAVPTEAPTRGDPSEEISLPLKPVAHLLTSSPPRAHYYSTARGGQTTYHGPGQLVVYTIFDLLVLRLKARSHIQLLEDVTIDVTRSLGVNGVRTTDPGVWVQDSQNSDDHNHNHVVPTRKIAAIGVHCRRSVTSYGIGFNVTNEPLWFFDQIVPCGLEGKTMTSLQREGVSSIGCDRPTSTSTSAGKSLLVDGDIDLLASYFVRMFAKHLNKKTADNLIEGIYPITDCKSLES